MKKTSTISRILLGILFLTFGLNGFLQFIKLPPPTGTAALFMGALFTSHELVIIMALQLVAGVLLLSNRFTALALVLLAPVIVNIVLFHVFMAPAGIPLALIAATLWVLAALGVREVFKPFIHPKSTTIVAA